MFTGNTKTYWEIGRDYSALELREILYVNKEIIILTSTWIIIALMLFLLVPKNKLREAIVIFFFKQFLTLSIGLAVVQFGPGI